MVEYSALGGYHGWGRAGGGVGMHFADPKFLSKISPRLQATPNVISGKRLDPT